MESGIKMKQFIDFVWIRKCISSKIVLVNLIVVKEVLYEELHNLFSLLLSEFL